MERRLPRQRRGPPPNGIHAASLDASGAIHRSGQKARGLLPSNLPRFVGELSGDHQAPRPVLGPGCGC